MGIIIVVGGIIISMVIAMYMYTQYQTNFITVKPGDSVVIGPVKYNVIFDGIHKGNDESIPKNTYVKIRINAKNISQEKTQISGGQFYLLDKNQQKHEAVYGEFSNEDLLYEWLEPDKPATWTTQFDVPYHDEDKYSVIIRPTKQQSSLDVAVICIKNC
jgi:hypothetical protein